MHGKEVRILSLLILDTAFFLVEAIVGYTVHSLALIADSFHMLNDIISLIIALWAVRFKNRKGASKSYTYGWQRAEILGALVNAVFLVALCVTIVIDALQRFVEPEVIKQPVLVLIVGTLGLLSNIVGLGLFHEHGHSHTHLSPHVEGEHNEHSHRNVGDSSGASISSYFPDAIVERYNEATPLVRKDGAPVKKNKSLNIESLFLHVLGDALGNIGVIVTALFIWKTDYSWRYYSDPMVSLLITVIILSSCIPLCRKSSKILLQATPTSLDPDDVLEEIIKLDTIKSVHDFHVWNLNEDILVASMHLELTHEEESVANNDTLSKSAFNGVVAQVREIIRCYGVLSVTIQPEFISPEASASKDSTNAHENIFLTCGETTQLTDHDSISHD